ncbi:hypothetical protein Taro_044448 [Colocasia esculenta]|uniref:Complex I assembly factor TIMMDC1, mitochondrial n=1 Tax=Colocasia esculenta TaxID=4460 RepID=A0A843X2R2_COLES|nr:hypothetical protein [Colocasia esculenta]
MDTPEITEQDAPKGNRRPPGTVNWGTATVIGIFAGLLYGGSREAAASVSKDAEVMLKLGSTPDKREQYRLMRDAMEKRFIRVTRGSIIGGVRLGMFTATFCSLQNFLTETRGVHDVYNIAGAGSATAALFGLICEKSIFTLSVMCFIRITLTVILFVWVYICLCSHNGTHSSSVAAGEFCDVLPGSLMWRGRNVLLGSSLGAALGFPLGWAHLKLVEKANEANSTSNSMQNAAEKDEAKGGVRGAIERLEGSLRK